MKCGLCLPHCPTYALKQDENESPRGRIALMQAVVENRLPVDAHLREHLDHCLGCRTCERVCPSGVSYGSMLDATKGILSRQRPAARIKSFFKGMALKAVTDKQWRDILYAILRFYQLSGLQSLLRASAILKLLRLAEFENLLPSLPKARDLATNYPAMTSMKGRIGLFTGCLNTAFDADTVHGTIGLLQQLGYEVIIPDRQTCCGALHLHSGKFEQYSEMAWQNIQAFEDLKLDKLVFLATGCGAQLHEYGRLAWSSAEQNNAAQDFTARLMEITAFLAEQDLSRLSFNPLRKQLATHTPCSLRNVLRQPDASQTLLKHIPGLDLQALPEQPVCCGAAGSYMLTQPSMSRQIRNLTLTQIDRQKIDIITSTNIGCALHLQAGLNGEIEVLHPVALLTRQLVSPK